MFLRIYEALNILKLQLNIMFFLFPVVQNNELKNYYSSMNLLCQTFLLYFDIYHQKYEAYFFLLLFQNF